MSDKSDMQPASSAIYSWIDLAQAFANGSDCADLCRPILERIVARSGATDAALHVGTGDDELATVVATGILDVASAMQPRIARRVVLPALRSGRCEHLSRAQLEELEVEGTAYQLARWARVIPLRFSGHPPAVLVLIDSGSCGVDQFDSGRFEDELGLLTLILVHDSTVARPSASDADPFSDDSRMFALRALRDLIPQVILVKDLDNRVVIANRAAGEFYHLDPRQMEGEYLWEVDPLNAAASYRADLAVAESGELSRGTVEEVMGLRGTRQWLRADRAPVFGRDGRVIAVVTAVEDITQSVRAEERLRESQQDAARAERRRDQYLLALAEEVSEPLRQVTRRMAQLRRDPAGETNLQALDEMLAIQRQALRSIQDLLDFSRVENGNLAVQTYDFDVEEVLSEVLVACQQAASRRAISLASRVAPQCPHRVAGDGNRIRQILLQLVAAALKVARGAEVFVTVQPVADADGQRLSFEVRAPSATLQPQELEEFFLSYRRDAIAEVQEDSPHHLRLSLARSLTHLLSGDVAVEVAPDRSFCCRCELPVRAPLDTERRGGAHRPRVGARVLLCEPNENMRAIHLQRLRDLELTVDAASSVDLGLEMVRAATRSGWPFDAVLVQPQTPDALQPLLRELDAGSASKLVVMTDDPTAPLPGESRILKLPWRQRELCALLIDLCGPRSEEPVTHRLEDADGGGHEFLIVDDQTLRANVTAFALRRLGGGVSIAGTREEALHHLEHADVDLVLVDEEWLDAQSEGFVDAVRRMDGSTRRTRIAVGVHEASASASEKWIAAGYEGCIEKPLDTDALFRILAGAGLLAR